MNKVTPVTHGLNINQPKSFKTFWLIISQWVLFAMIAASVALVLLIRDRDQVYAKYNNCQNTVNLINEQIGSGRIILDIKK
jgi:hypothetical protein